MKILKAGSLYFALVFGIGFVLGTLRTLWIAPLLGARTAELLEAPVMLMVSWLAARWAVRRFAVPCRLAVRLDVGLLALAFMLGAEFGFVLWLRGLTLRQYLATRDPVSGAAYYLSLVCFTILPALVARKKPDHL